jgi:2'-5' RNA ligase
MRLFVAIVPPEGVLEHLDEFLSVRRQAADRAEGFRWTVPDQWHLTLAFMESVAERHLDDLVERLGRAAHRRTPFELGFAGGGAFPNAGRAKVLWLGVSGDTQTQLVGARTEPSSQELSRLATGARAAATRAGAVVAGGKFRPHLTLARLGRPQEVTKWVRLLDAYEGPRWTVEEFALIESHLGEGPRKRPRHVVLETFKLG